MYILDTDHLSVLERGGKEAQRLLSHLADIPPEETAATIISYEEQTRGWLSYMAKARSLQAQVEAYERLTKHLENYCSIPLLPFDLQAVEVFERLQKARLRVGTMDLKIAAIVLSNEAILLTRNLPDFNLVPGLQNEDWTI